MTVELSSVSPASYQAAYKNSKFCIKYTVLRKWDHSVTKPNGKLSVCRLQTLKTFSKTMALCWYSIGEPKFYLNELNSIAETVTAWVPFWLICCHQGNLKECIAWLP